MSFFVSLEPGSPVHVDATLDIAMTRALEVALPGMRVVIRDQTGSIVRWSFYGSGVWHTAAEDAANQAAEDAE